MSGFWGVLQEGLVRFALAWDWMVLSYFLALNCVYLILYIASYREIVRHLRRLRVPFQRSLFNSPMCPPISILVPSYNEENVIVDSVRSLLSLQYRQHEVIVINDGSTDRTLEALQKAFDLESAPRVDPGLVPTAVIRGAHRSRRHLNLLVVDKENGGKSDALNAGINFSRYPLFCSMDADSVLEPQALLRVVKPFMSDPRVVAVGATVRVANGIRIREGEVEAFGLPQSALPLFQIVDYMRAFYAGRMGWSALGCVVLISGAFGLFKKEVVLRCGGYRRETVGEDMDLVVRMHRLLREEKQNYRMVFIPDPVCWTQAPETWEVLRAQRDRWQRGLAETLLSNLKMMFNPRYGRIGLWALPCHLFFELLGPIVEFAGYVSVLVFLVLLELDLYWLRLFFLAAVLFGVILSLSAVLFEEMSFHRYPRVRHLLVLLLFAFLENFGFRQINAWWKCRAVFRVLWRQRGWGKMAHESFAASGAALLALALAGPARGEGERYTVRLSGDVESYSFASTGGGAGLALQDRRWRGLSGGRPGAVPWNASIGADRVHRFGKDDFGVHAQASRPWLDRRFWAGFHVGAATPAKLLPRYRLSLIGGTGLGRGLSLEGSASYRHYPHAGVWGFSPALVWERSRWLLVAGPSLSWTFYDSGGASGGLLSWRARLKWTGRRAFHPWLGFAYAKESFEPGSSAGVRNFAAHVYQAGLEAALGRGWRIQGSFVYEDRQVAFTSLVRRWNLGLSYSWGKIR